MLKGPRLFLRALEPSDVEVLYRWENDPAVWEVSHTLVPFSKKTLSDFVHSEQDIYLARQARFMICLQEGRQAIGAIDLFDFDPFHQRVGIGVLIADEAHRRLGYASEALDVLLNYCFSVLPIEQVFCNILTSNVASIQLFQQKGFEITGTKKQWIRKIPDRWEDELFLQLLRADYHPA